MSSKASLLPGTLDLLILKAVSLGPQHGYGVLLRIEQRGLVDVEKVPSEKGPPRKVYTLNAQGRDSLAEFWGNWSFLADRLEQLRTDNEGN